MNSEKLLILKLKELKRLSGSHSPSIFTIVENIPEIKIKIDACFLSNPYATDLFFKYLQNEIISTGKLRYYLESYPSQNNIIAELLSDFIGIEKDYIFVGNGATEIIQAVLHNFVKRKIVVCIPTFSPYYEFVREDTEVVFYPLKKANLFNIDINNYIDFIKKEKPDTIVIINPNNPNGGYIKKKDLEYLVSNLQEVENIIIDESFIHFAYENEAMRYISNIDLFKKYPNVILIKSMSKDFGIAGLRAGYAIMEKNKVQMLLNNGYLWNINGLAEYFFRLYVRPEFQSEYEKIRKIYIKETQDFFKKLSSIKHIKVYPSMANFVLIELPSQKSADDFVFKLLIRYGIYTRSCKDKVGLEGEFVRISSRKPEENNLIFNSILNILG